MLAGVHFYHKSIRRYTGLMGSLFANMVIVRKAGGRTQKIPVPIGYSSGQNYSKYVGNRDARENVPRVRNLYPCLVYTLTDFMYDPQRKTNSREKYTSTIGTDDKAEYVFNRVPYDFNYEVAIKTKNMDDMLQIVEQIIPYFDPTLCVKIEDLSGEALSVAQDVIITLNNTQIDDIFEGDMEEPRTIECTMNFTLKGYLYKRIIQGVAANHIVYNWTDSDDQPIDTHPLFTVQGERDQSEIVADALDDSLNKHLFALTGRDSELEE